MRARWTNRFRRDFLAASQDIQQRFEKQAALLLRDLRHPGLHAKKFDAARDIWQARVNAGWRFYFRIEGDTYILETMRPHPK